MSWKKLNSVTVHYYFILHLDPRQCVSGGRYREEKLNTMIFTCTLQEYIV